MEKKIVLDKPFEPHVNRELCMRMTYNKYTRRYDLHNDDKLILSDHCRPRRVVQDHAALSRWIGCRTLRSARVPLGGAGPG